MREPFSALSTVVRETGHTESGRRADYRVTFVVLCLGVASFSLLQSMVNPVLPTIEGALHTDQATVTWVLTAYLLSASVCTPIIGRVGDKVGKERMLVVALGALAVGLAAGGGGAVASACSSWPARSRASAAACCR